MIFLPRDVYFSIRPIEGQDLKRHDLPDVYQELLIALLLVFP